MMVLVEPSGKYLESYREAYREYQAMGIHTYGLTDPDSCDLFEKYENYRYERNLKSDRVGSDYYWLVDDEKDYFIGEITIRHRLNDVLRLRGGHIGYGVRCGEWGKGYATHMLALALPMAKALGIDRALITCNDDNRASARVMEKNGFRMEDKVQTDTGLTRRYWKTL